ASDTELSGDQREVVEGRRRRGYHSVKPAVCVYSTWFTCSRRAGCQQQPRHFTFTLLDPNRCQEVRTSTIRCTDTGRTAGSSSVEG
ncbi:hypothetical protein KUCAC02_013768, partial [Chaenocephalus aceratus]